MYAELKPLKSQLSERIRPSLEKRDGPVCRACNSTEGLQVAHVTSARAFCYRMGWTKEALEASYRLDNVVLLCRPCHGAQTLGANRISWTRQSLLKASPGSYEYVCAQNRLWIWRLKSCDDEEERRLRVATLFRGIQRERGWLSAIDVVRGRAWDGSLLPAWVERTSGVNAADD